MANPMRSSITKRWIFLEKSSFVVPVVIVTPSRITANPILTLSSRIPVPAGHAVVTRVRTFQREPISPAANKSGCK